MTAEELNAEQKTIDDEVKQIAEQLNAEAVYDGATSPEHYLLRPIKTLWVLREPHDSGGGWDYKKGVKDRLNKVDKREIRTDKYFGPMRYLEHSLNNNLDIPFSNQDSAVPELLLNIATANINKIVGGSSVNWSIFPNYVDKFSGVVKKQLKVLDPKIIIASGTIDFFRKHGYLNDTSVHAKDYRKFYANEKHIILDCYHLAHRNTISREGYCNDIISALKDAKLKGFLN